MHLFRQERCRAQIQKTGELIGSTGGELAKEAYDLGSLFHRVDYHPCHDLRSYRMGLVLEGSNDAEVAARLCADRALLSIDVDALETRQIDRQSVISEGGSSNVMAAAAHRDENVVVTNEVDRLDDIGCPAAADN